MSENKPSQPRKIEITKLVLKIGNREIELTPEEARDLKYKLEEILAPVQSHTIYVYPSYPQLNTWPRITYYGSSGTTGYAGGGQIGNAT